MSYAGPPLISAKLFIHNSYPIWISQAGSSALDIDQRRIGIETTKKSSSVDRRKFKKIIKSLI
jgi:hypothetical protein